MINYHYPAFSQAGNGSVKHRPMEQSIEMPSVFKKMTRQVYNAEPYSLDDTMDTSEMMNQMVQMQMVTAITNMTETNIMSYATSLSYSDWYLLTFMPYGYMDSVVSHFSQEWGILTILRPSSSLVPCCWCSTSITPMPAGNSMMWRRFGLWRRQPG